MQRTHFSNIIRILEALELVRSNHAIESALDVIWIKYGTWKWGLNDF